MKQAAANGTVSTRRNSPIDLSPEEFRRIGFELIDQIALLLGDMENRPVAPNITPAQVREKINSEQVLPTQGCSAEKLISKSTELLFNNSLFNGHPRFFGYITSSAAPLGILGNLLAAAVNPNVGAWQLSPMATEIEAQTVRWIAELLDYPVDCGGLLVSGGNMANFVGFLAARAHAADFDIRAEGFQNGHNRRLTVYASKETHTWIQKAADLFGLGTNAIRWIKTDSEFRMDMQALENAVDEDVKNDCIPMMVVGSAGTVSTGAIDPLPEMVAFCKEKKIWFHVDGAYGGFAAAVKNVDSAIYALSEADSVAVDPHKWLYTPLEAGCALVRDREKLRNAFSYHPPYYHFDEEAINYFDSGLQNSRGFRALKVWLTLQQVGREGYEAMIEEDIRLAGEMYRVIAEYPQLEALTNSLSITTFRFVPEDLESRVGEKVVDEYLDRLNEEILNRLKISGKIFVSNAVLNERFVLRACIVNFRTSQIDVEAVPVIVANIGEQTDKELRPSELR